MRPHRLRVQAFGAFAGTEQVTFDDLEGLFLLHGETGAGKTTLLDAIAFALYGRVPGERGSAKRLRSDHAAPGLATEVELEATIGGRHLRITRKPEQERPNAASTPGPLPPGRPPGRTPSRSQRRSPWPAERPVHAPWRLRDCWPSSVSLPVLGSWHRHPSDSPLAGLGAGVRPAPRSPAVHRRPSRSRSPATTPVSVSLPARRPCTGVPLTPRSPALRRHPYCSPVAGLGAGHSGIFRAIAKVPRVLDAILPCEVALATGISLSFSGVALRLFWCRRSGRSQTANDAGPPAALTQQGRAVAPGVLRLPLAGANQGRSARRGRGQPRQAAARRGAAAGPAQRRGGTGRGAARL